MKEWYSATIRYILVSPDMEKSEKVSKLDVTYLLKANDFEDAFKVALALGRKNEKSDGVLVNDKISLLPRFKEVLTLDYVGKKLDDGVEVLSNFDDLELSDEIDFNTGFSPEESEPSQTI